MSQPFASIIIPVLNDTPVLAAMLATLNAGADVEILVVDGGSTDECVATRATMREDTRWVTSLPGRGRQMNSGARSARGRWLVFLHADTRLPDLWLDELRRLDGEPSIVGGSFRFRLDSEARSARLLERGVALRVRYFDLPFGDQALFVRSAVFEALGGYREWPLMEDVDLVRRLRRMGRLHHSSLPAVTSARRWEREGWCRRSAGNVTLLLLFLAGVPPDRLVRWYRPAPAVPPSAPGNATRRRAAVAVMARAPSDDRGKTRLTGVLSGHQADLRRALLLDTLDAVSQVRHADRFVLFDPPDAAAEFSAITAGAARLLRQRGDDLGARLRHAFADLFALGYSRVVILGSDVPTIAPRFVEQALESLDGARESVVLGPAADGGYYLIGLRSRRPELFQDIPWSTSDALAVTLQVAGASGLAVSLTPEWYDVDDIESLRRAANESSGGLHTRAWMNAFHQDLNLDATCSPAESERKRNE